MDEKLCGKRVKIKSLNIIGRVIGHDNRGDVTVACTIGRILVSRDDVELLSKPTIKFKTLSHQRTRANRKNKISIDLHGLTLKEALSAVNECLDKSALKGIQFIEIIHGIGTGKIKQALYQHLSNSPYNVKILPHPTNPGKMIVHFI